MPETSSPYYFILRTGSEKYDDKPEKEYHFKEGIPGSRQLRNAEDNAKFVYLENGEFYGKGEIGEIISEEVDGVTHFKAQIKNYEEIQTVAFSEVEDKISRQFPIQFGIIKIKEDDYGVILGERGEKDKLTIAKAAEIALERIEKPSRPEEIYNRIMDEGLYEFGAEDPVDVVRVQMDRHAKNVDRQDSAAPDLFYRREDGKYGLLASAEEKASYGKSIDLGAPLQISLNDTVFDSLYFPEEQREELLQDVEAALNSEKHIIFTGPPGTGKTALAENVAESISEEEENVTGYRMTTATSDWSTFDTVGGYMPSGGSDGDLEFNAGHFLRRFRDDGRARNELLIIDEINRADIDKAFGQLLTVLSGQKVQLPFKTEGGQEVEIVPASYLEEGEKIDNHRFVVPESWRLLATMNTYDKTSLYEMSYAFMRRFAFIRVEVPEVPSDEDEQVELLKNYTSEDVWDLEASDETLSAVAKVWGRTNNAIEGRKIGPAIVKDILSFVAESGETESALTRAVISYVLPQLEGVHKRQKVVEELIGSGEVQPEKLKRTAMDMLQIEFDEER